MQLDSLQKGVENSVHEAVNVLESVGAGTVGTIGAGLIAPSLGIALLPGIILFGSAYYIMKLALRKKGNTLKVILLTLGVLAFVVISQI
jgi:hypothetical protein